MELIYEKSPNEKSCVTGPFTKARVLKEILKNELVRVASEAHGVNRWGELHYTRADILLDQHSDVVIVFLGLMYVVCLFEARVSEIVYRTSPSEIL
jgi:hypothetical protein